MKIGEKHNQLTCIGKDKEKDKRYYFFLCDCGNVKSIIFNNVISGATKSCGCLKNKGNNRKHGQSKTRLYRIWKSMRERCNNPNTNRSKFYYFKGIVVCDEWNDFINFRNWALDNGYSDSLTIDRINPLGNYEPNNCRWVTYKVQANNKSNNRILEFDNKKHTLGEWSDITGMSISALCSRLNRGWSIERTLTENTRYN